MHIDDLTIKQARELSAMFGQQPKSPGLNGMLGRKVIIRTHSAGNWFGTLAEKAGSEVILKDARRMWYWKAAQGISLSACSVHGIDQHTSRIVAPVEAVWLDAIEIILCTDAAVTSIEEAPHAVAG